jgi:hypothetical protein
MLCEALEKYYSFPGFTLLLGSLFHTKLAGLGDPGSHLHLMEAHLYMIRHWGDGHIIEDSGFPGDWDYAEYFVELLESPERSGTHIFDQKRYATAAKECLQLYLCSHRDFSKGATEFACRDMAICRSKPWAWVARLGVRSRIRKGRRHFKALRRQSIKASHRDFCVIPSLKIFTSTSITDSCRTDGHWTYFHSSWSNLQFLWNWPMCCVVIPSR